MDKIYDVVIVGAGPIGLATAIGLRQQATLRRVSYCSEQEWKAYNQQVYARNFAEIIQSLLI